MQVDGQCLFWCNNRINFSLIDDFFSLHLHGHLKIVIADIDTNVFEIADTDAYTHMNFCQFRTWTRGGHAYSPISGSVNNFIKVPDQIHLNNSTDDLVFEKKN